MKSVRAAAAVVAVVVVTGCGGGGGTARAVTPQVCIDALDQADAAFTQLSANISTVKEAFDQASAGDPSDGTATLQQVQRIDAAPYKDAEAKCRALQKVSR